MAPSNPSVLSPSPAGTIVSPLTSMSTSTSTTTNASAQGESSAGDYTKITSQSNNSGPGRSGRWTPDEKLLFLHGLKLHGRGRWKKIRYYLPTRTLIQIKSHAQKVLKREELGDNVFLPLKANKDKVDALLQDKSKLYTQRMNDPVTTLMSSDGRYHTISMQQQQEETGSNHTEQQQPQQGLPVVQTPLPPGYPSPYYKTTVGNPSHPMPPYVFQTPGTNHPPDPMQQQQQQQPPSSAGPPYNTNHHHHNQHHSPMMHHHHHPQQSQQQQHHYYNHSHQQHHHPPQHGIVHHISPPHPSPHQQPQHLPLHVTTTTPPPFKVGVQDGARMVPDAGTATAPTNRPTEQQQQQQLFPRVLHPQTPQSRKATTDALAAAALCELFRGEGKDLEQVSV